MICSAYPTYKRPILIDVDTQSHFFRDNSPVCIYRHQAVLNAIKKVMNWARDCHIPTISTLQVHPSDASYQRGAEAGRLSLKKPACTLWPNHLDLAATDRLDWSCEMWQHYDQIIVQKRSYDPFDEPRADRILSELSADNECIIVGTPIEGAVRATALGLLQRQKQVTIVTDAVGSLSPASGKWAWNLLHSKNIRFVPANRLTTSCPRRVIPVFH